MTKVTVAMLGARRHYALPRVLHEAGLLERFYTDNYMGNKPWLEAALNAIPPWCRPGGVQRWLERKDTVLPPEKAISFEGLGLWYAWALRYVRGSMQREKVCCEVARRFNQRVLAAGLGDAGVVMGFDGAALELFEAARRQGKRCIVEQTIAPVRIQHELLIEEWRRWPGWQPGLDGVNYPNLLSEREEAEWGLADLIVAGSEFVAEGLRTCGVPTERIRVVPYGVDSGRFQPIGRSNRSGPLRVLFAGEVGLRKGAPYLLDALRLLDSGTVEARFAGGISLAPSKLAAYDGAARFLGAVPRSAMAELFAWADVFVLPSICEGSAVVTYEALASGLPVICTPNAGSVVRDGVDGFIVPIRNPEGLAEALRRYHEDRDLLTAHQAAALQGRERLGLGRYREDLVQVIEGLATVACQIM
jgi:glycosyltransferase involved in cell wall biosynthesis